MRGVIEAKRTSRRLGYDHQQIGFNYAFRSSGAVAATTPLLARGGTARRGAAAAGHRLDRARHLPGHVHPGPAAPVPIVDIGDSFLEGLAQLRECYMPKAGFGSSTPLRIEETGYPTGPGRTEAAQLRAAREFVRDGGGLPRHLRDQRLPLVRAARQQQRGAQLPVVLRPAPRRLLAEARVRRLPQADRAVRALQAPGARAPIDPRGGRREHAAAARRTRRASRAARPRSRAGAARPPPRPGGSARPPGRARSRAPPRRPGRRRS